MIWRRLHRLELARVLLCDFLAVAGAGVFALGGCGATGRGPTGTMLLDLRDKLTPEKVVTSTCNAFPSWIRA